MACLYLYIGLLSDSHHCHVFINCKSSTCLTNYSECRIFVVVNGENTVLLHLFQNLDSEKEKELERQARIEASLREREREVQKARSEQTKEIDREREQHKREEAIQNFKALLSDMVRLS